MANERVIATRIKLNGEKEFRRGMRAAAQEVKAFGGWTDVLKGTLGSAAIQKGLQAIANYFNKAWNASVDFETAMAGVAKTTDLSAVELSAMGDSIKELSERIPVSTTELAGLVETAGQLGIADEYLLSFSETMAALGVSTNMASTEAATALAQFANVMQTSGKDYERMGSSIVALGNNSATTESNIVDMSQRLAGAARIVRMSEAQVFGYAAALSSVGVEAEAGGSALSKVWSEIETLVATGSDDLEGWAKVAGMSAAEFAAAWKGDASGAFKTFVQGLGNADKRGQSAIATLSGLGITEIRTTRAVLGLATAGDLLERSLATSETAWEQNTALAKEAGTRYGTTASQITMAENAVNNLNIAVGDKFKPLVTEIAGMGAESAKALEQALTGQKTLITMVDGVEQSYQKQALSIKATAGQAYALVDRLDELGDVSKLTGAEQQEYLATLGLLKQIMPSAAGAINTETGAIEGGTAALRDNIAAAQANAEQVADLDAAKNRYDALTIAQENLGKKRALYTMAIADQSSAQAKLNALFDRQNELFEQATKDADEMSKQGGVIVTPDALLQGNEEWLALDGSIREASDALGGASGKVDALNASITTEAEALANGGQYADEYANKLDAMGQTLEGVADKEGAITEAGQLQVDEFQAMSDRLTQLESDLVDATDQARKQVDDVVSGFGKIEMPEPQSAKDTIKNLQSQIDYMNTYKKNLKEAQKLGLSDELTKQLSDGSEESASILQGIVDDGGKNIDALNTKFAEVSTGKEAMATAMAEAQTDFQTKSDAIVAATNTMVDNFNQEGAAKTAAAATIQGVIDGMNSKLAALQALSDKIKHLANPTGSSGGSDNNFQPNDNDHTSHASGLAYVPYDNYGALLHRGEMVLTALEARAYRAEQFANYASPAIAGASAAANNTRTIHNTNTISLAGAIINVRDQQDIRALAYELNSLQTAQVRALGGTP